MKIDNLKLRTKALIPLAVMCLAVAGIVGFGAWRLDDLSRSAGEIIAHRDKAAIFVARATGTTMMAPYSAFGALVYDGSSPEGRTAQADFGSQLDKLNSLMDCGEPVPAPVRFDLRRLQGESARKSATRARRSWRSARTRRASRPART